MTINNRYDFVMLFDVENGNPNGDPDAGNAPRMDAETGHGYITDVCIKRKVRNYVELTMEEQPGYNILVKPDRSLNSKFTEAYEEEGLKTGQKGKNADDVKKACEYMCANYFDVRAFGALCPPATIHAGLSEDLFRSILPRVFLRYSLKMLPSPDRPGLPKKEPKQELQR